MGRWASEWLREAVEAAATMATAENTSEIVQNPSSLRLTPFDIINHATMLHAARNQTHFDNRRRHIDNRRRHNNQNALLTIINETAVNMHYSKWEVIISLLAH